MNADVVDMKEGDGGLVSVAKRSDGFFSRSNIYTAGWGLLLGSAGYFFGLIDPFDRKPQEVVVKNFDAMPRDSKDPSTVVAFDSDARAEMIRLRNALADTRRALNKVAVAKESTGETNAVIPSSQLEQLREAKDALRDALASTVKAEKNDVSQMPAHSPISLLTPDAASLSLQMPPENRGYTLNPPVSLAGIRCPTFNPSTKRLRFAFNVTDSRLRNMSVLRVTVASVEGPLQQTHMFGEDFLARSGSNEVELDFDPAKGTYDVTLGYFDKRKLAGEFPPFYGVSCTVIV